MSKQHTHPKTDSVDDFATGEHGEQQNYGPGVDPDRHATGEHGEQQFYPEEQVHPGPSAQQMAEDIQRHRKASGEIGSGYGEQELPESTYVHPAPSATDVAKDRQRLVDFGTTVNQAKPVITDERKIGPRTAPDIDTPEQSM